MTWFLSLLLPLMFKTENHLCDAVCVSRTPHCSMHREICVVCDRLSSHYYLLAKLILLLITLANIITHHLHTSPSIISILTKT